MKFKSEVYPQPEAGETNGKFFSRAYCRTEGIWIDDWDTHFEMAVKDKMEHTLKTCHSVTIHYK